MAILAGCVSQTYKDIDEDSKKLILKVDSAKAQASVIQFVKHSSKWYIPKIKQARVDMPEWCYKANDIGVYKKAPLRLIVKSLIDGLPVNVTYAPDVNKDLPITIASNRDVCDGLRKVSLASGYSFEVNDSQIRFKALEDRVVDVAFSPGISKYFMGSEKKQEGQGQGQGQGQQQGQGQITTQTSETLNKSSAYKGIEATLDPWNNLVATLRQMTSQKGFIGPNPVASNILLRDTPERVESMSRYIETLNRSVNRVIKIEMEIIEITRNDGDTEALDIKNIIESFNGSKGAITASAEFANSLFSDSNVPYLDFAITKPQDGQSESILVQALKRKGKVAVTKKQTAITLNNQIVRIKEVINDTYLAQSKKDATANVGVTDELIPGSVQSGLDMYALPREYNNMIQLHLSTAISNLLALGEVSSGNSKIQAPRLSEKEFDMIAILPPNTAVMLTGTSNVRTESSYSGTVDDRKFWLSELLGFNRSSSKEITETIILVSAHLIYKET